MAEILTLILLSLLKENNEDNFFILVTVDKINEVICLKGIGVFIWILI